jgi:hypothetical protein
MHSDENGRPRLAVIWSVEGLDEEGEIILMEETTKASAGADLPAEASRAAAAARRAANVSQFAHRQRFRRRRALVSSLERIVAHWYHAGLRCLPAARHPCSSSKAGAA